MLVLSRRAGERVWIGGSIRVEVLEVGGGRVKLGFSAPPDVDVLREEIRGAYAGQVEPWHESSAIGQVYAQA
jgi:carbon storage regulator